MKIYTDGSVIGNPGPGGWAFAAVVNRQIIYSASGMDAPSVGIGRMELMALYQAMVWQARTLPSEPTTYMIDSQYVVRALNEWIEGWKSNGWKKSNRKKVAHIDLWEDIYRLKTDQRFVWIPAHTGADDEDSQMNDWVDKQARQMADMNANW